MRTQLSRFHAQETTVEPTHLCQEIIKQDGDQGLRKVEFLFLCYLGDRNCWLSYISVTAYLTLALFTAMGTVKPTRQ